jgi:hypothetical protein
MQMNFESAQQCHDHGDLVFLYVLQVLPPTEIAGAETHFSSCTDCQQELESLRPLVGAFTSRPTDVVRPAQSLWPRLAQRIGNETGTEPLLAPPEISSKPQWEQAAPGIHVKILSKDEERDMVSMLVRLDPGTDYPAHVHAGVEDLHLLHGILHVDDRTLYPGDFIHAEAGSVDQRVWSETGCTCFLMTSTKDALF